MPEETTPPQEIPQTPPPEAPTEPIPASESTPEPQTAQMGGNEPLPSETSSEAKPEPAEEPEIPEVEPVDKSAQILAPQEQSAPVVIPPPVNTNPIRELLNKARNAIQFRKRNKLDKIMTLFAKRTKITNDEVEKLLHVSDSTATRYLSILKKEGKILQTGKTGKSVSYSKL